MKSGIRFGLILLLLLALLLTVWANWNHFSTNDAKSAGIVAYEAGDLPEAIHRFRQEIEATWLPSYQQLANLRFAREQVLHDADYKPSTWEAFLLQVRPLSVLLMTLSIVLFVLVSLRFTRTSREVYYQKAASKSRLASTWLLLVLGVGMGVVAALPWLNSLVTAPWAVVKLDQTILKTGNGLSYSQVFINRVAAKVPTGSEVKLLLNRDNNWSQIQLHNGTIGWIPTEGLVGVQPATD